MMLIMAVSKTEVFERIIFWMMGSLEQNNWGLIRLALVLSVTSLVVSYFFAIDLFNAMSLGEEQAVHLGIDIERSKRFLFIIASVITGFSVSVAGVISFVGLLIPHFMRMLVEGTTGFFLSLIPGGSGFLLSVGYDCQNNHRAPGTACRGHHWTALAEFFSSIHYQHGRSGCESGH